MKLEPGYIVRRLLMFAFTVWVAASLNFTIPRLAPSDPLQTAIGRMNMRGTSTDGSAEMIDYYRQRFGLDEGLGIQYLRFLHSMISFNFGYSISSFPVEVREIIARGMPWTIGLLATSTLFSFFFGTSLGALLGWHRRSSLINVLSAPLLILSSIPYYLLAVLLLYIFAFQWKVFPVGGTRPIGSTGTLGISMMLEILHHSILPALSLILISTGGWALSMRALMITVLETDYLQFAKAKGLRDRHVLVHYALRNAILPQITGLAIALGTIVSGVVLVEVIFSYPGIGYHLYRAIRNLDYTVIQGITFILVLSVAFSVLILDLVYPLFDPRVTNKGK